MRLLADFLILMLHDSHLFVKAFNSMQTHQRACANDTEIMDYLLVENNSTYQKNRLPTTPVEVRIEIWVQEVTSLSEMTQDFEIDLYMNEYWTDPRLSYDFLSPCQRNLSFDWIVMQDIWTPNTCFINSKHAQLHSSPFTNVFLMVFPNGSIWSNWRIKSTGPCKMNISKFPMDDIECQLIFESYNYNNREVKMRWNSNPYLQFKNISLPEFDMKSLKLSRETREYAAGYWDELKATFYFRRRYQWYLLQGYIPTYMTVFISWISFYLGAKAIPARTMICVNALLAMNFQFGNIMRNLPRSSDLKAIDIWMISGMLFVFASLVELAVVGWFMQEEAKPSFSRDNSRRWNLSKTSVMGEAPKKSRNLQYCECVDFYSRIMFPLVYSLYNFYYWFIYMRASFELLPYEEGFDPNNPIIEVNDYEKQYFQR
ncbi:hypothetical protein WR25_17879 [Diploscapter pachys]|uniref:Neurotransmitter-gated ion-channel ligand-binding domain-containing protein n=1 Tax=Diploscapter pachys TaxID=2018661 RepID=A0A2A2JSE8_9BILA|nr:hypothetical protein WR25_17879 [Diploscapter pachys]